MENDRSVNDLLDELANDPTAVAARAAVCDSISTALAYLGKLFWVTGYIAGTDRKSGTSPFKFGSDAAVGIATIMQIGGELGSGAIQLLQTGNRYAASALIRQLVEVEYLVHAFDSESNAATEWLRANREERLRFWSPAKLRKKSSAAFLPSDYWQHCERGGHPTREAMALLPEHAGLEANYLWVDLAGHLASIWLRVEALSERLMNGPIPPHWELPDVTASLSSWRSSDGLYAALSDLARRLRDDDDTDESS